MNSPAFFDTNILIYADDASAPAKQARAIQLFTDHQRSGRAVISLQIMQEYFNAVTRKLGVDPELAQRKIELFARGRVVRFAPADVVAAVELHRLTQISFWDALVVHAARLSGATVLYTEDLQHGATVAGVPIVNPFVVSDVQVG